MAEEKKDSAQAAIDEFDEDEVGASRKPAPQFSSAALEWSELNFGSQDNAYLFDQLGQRPAEDIAEMKKVRVWECLIRNIRYLNMDELFDVFLQISVGHNFELKKKYNRVAVSRLKRHKKAMERRAEAEAGNESKEGEGDGKKDDGDDGKGKGKGKGKDKGKKRKEADPLNGLKLYEWVEHGTTGTTFRTTVKRNVKSGDEVEFDDRFECTWKGSYIDLFNFGLQIEAWDWNTGGVNNFLCSGRVPLINIARGTMAQDMDLKGMIQEAGKVHRVERKLGRVGMVMVFQERVSFALKLANMRASIDRGIFRGEEGAGDQPVSAPGSEDPPEGEEVVGPGAGTGAGAGTGVGTGAGLAKDGTADDTEDQENQRQPFMVRAVFDLNKPTRSAVQYLSMHRTSTWDRQDLLPDAKRVTPVFRVERPMYLSGTRLTLDDSVLDVRLYELDNKRSIARCRIPLKGITASGFVQAQIARYRGDTVVPAGRIQGQVDVSIPKALLWKEFVQIGELSPPELKDYPPFNYTYLAIRLERARDLIAMDDNGLSDPYAIVEWGGQRYESRVHRFTLNPNFNEVFYFHVRTFHDRPRRSDLEQFPFATITLWDWDESGSAECLGWTRFYISSVTGVRGVSQRPLKRITIKRRASRFSSRFQEVEAVTRQTTEKLRLTQTLRPEIKSTIVVTGWFRGPPRGSKQVIDLQEHDQEVCHEQGNDLIFLPGFDTEQEKMNRKLCCCYTDDGSSGAKRKCDEAMRGPKCRTVAAFEKDLELRSHKAGRDILAKMYLAKRPFSTYLVRRDQEGVPHFLPEFLQPLVPPKDMISRLDEPYMVAEEAAYRPNTAWEVFYYVRNIAFASEHQFNKPDDSRVEKMEDVVLAPPFLLDMRTGDIKDHVMLLCAMFLGIGLDAYVCIGTAMQKNPNDLTKLEEKEHWWVMTREDQNACCGEDQDTMWYTNNGAVRFWEVTLGRVFSLPERWEGQDPDTWGVKFARRRRQKPKPKKRKPKPEVYDTKEELDSEEEAEDLSWLKKEEELAEEHMQSKGVDMESIFMEGAGMGDGWGKTPQLRQMAELAAKYAQEERIRAAEEKKRREEELRQLQASAGHIRRLRRIDELVKEQPPPHMPYVTLNVCFNARNVFFNALGDEKTAITDPRYMSFDFQFAETDFTWTPLITEERGAEFRCFYPARGLTPKMSDDKVEELENDIVMDIEAAISNARSAAEMRTKFASTEMRVPLMKYLIAVHNMELMDRNAENGWDFKAHAWKKDPEMRGYRAFAALHQARQHLAVNVPPNYKYRLVAAAFPTIDSMAVRQEFLAHKWRSKPGKAEFPHLEDHSEYDMIAVAARVFSMYNGVAVARVGMIVVYPDPSSESFEPWRPPSPSDLKAGGGDSDSDA